MLWFFKEWLTSCTGWASGFWLWATTLRSWWENGSVFTLMPVLQPVFFFCNCDSVDIFLSSVHSTSACLTTTEMSARPSRQWGIVGTRSLWDSCPNLWAPSHFVSLELEMFLRYKLTEIKKIQIFFFPGKAIILYVALVIFLTFAFPAGGTRHHQWTSCGICRTAWAEGCLCIWRYVWRLLTGRNRSYTYETTPCMTIVNIDYYFRKSPLDVWVNMFLDV